MPLLGTVDCHNNNAGHTVGVEHDDQVKTQTGMPMVLRVGNADPLTGSTAEATLATIALPGRLLGRGGRVRVSTTWSCRGGAATLALRLAGELLATATIAGPQAIVWEFFNRGSSTAQLCPPSTTTAIDTTVDQSITITGQLTSTGGTLTLESYLAEAFPWSSVFGSAASSTPPAPPAVLPAGAGSASSPLAQTMALLGDSFAGNQNGGSGPSGLTFTRAGGIVTVTGASAANHPFFPGALISVTGMAVLTDNVQRTPCVERVSANSFSYASAGADGVLAQSVGAMAVCHAVQQGTGFFTQFNRLTGGAYTLVQNAGQPGAKTDYIASMVPYAIAPFAPARVVFWAGYNDIVGGYTVAQTVANIKTAVNAYPQALWDIFSTSPFNAGAPANTAANLRQLNRYYPALKAAFAGYPNVRVHDSMALFASSTGLARAGYIKAADNVHPTQRMAYEAAKYLAALDGPKQTGIALPVTALDTYGVDAASDNLLDNPLFATQVAASAGFTGFMPTGSTLTLTGAITTAPAGTVTANPRADGFGNDFALAYTPDQVGNTVQMLTAIPVARLVSGEYLDAVCQVSITGLVAASVKGISMNLVFMADGVTYAASAQEHQNSAATAGEGPQEDMVGVTLSLRRVRVPIFTTSLTTARCDVAITHTGTGGAVTVKIGRFQVSRSK